MDAGSKSQQGANKYQRRPWVLLDYRNCHPPPAVLGRRLRAYSNSGISHRFRERNGKLPTSTLASPAMTVLNKSRFADMTDCLGHAYPQPEELNATTITITSTITITIIITSTYTIITIANTNTNTITMNAVESLVFLDGFRASALGMQAVASFIRRVRLEYWD